MIVTADGREFVRTGNDDGGVVADVEFFKVGEGCTYQTDVDSVMADVECAEAGEGRWEDEVNLVMVCDEVLYRGAGNRKRQGPKQVMADGKGSQVWQGKYEVRDVGNVVEGEVQDTELFHPGDFCRDLCEALVTQVKLPEVWRNHRDALTLQGRTMEGSDVK